MSPGVREAERKVIEAAERLCERGGYVVELWGAVYKLQEARRQSKGSGQRGKRCA